MAKTKTPFFGLGSQGSIGGTVTTQKRHQLTMVRTKPTPTYRRTLPQAYQRWLYEDYAYLWRQQTSTVKQQYATAGSHYHLTGFQYWMRIQLSLLPDYLGWWKLDDNQPPTVVDSSRNSNTGTIFGASPADGAIGPALLFDGINDYINCGSGITQALTAFTILAWIKGPTLTAPIGMILHRGLWAAGNVQFFVDNAGTPNVLRLNAFEWLPLSLKGTVVVQTDLWVPVAATWDGTTASIYVNGLLDVAGNIPGVISAGALPTTIGVRPGSAYWYKGVIDDVRFLSRCLDSTEILRHSERRYPL